MWQIDSTTSSSRKNGESMTEKEYEQIKLYKKEGVSIDEVYTRMQHLSRTEINVAMYKILEERLCPICNKKYYGFGKTVTCSAKCRAIRNKENVKKSKQNKKVQESKLNQYMKAVSERKLNYAKMQIMETLKMSRQLHE